MVHGRCEFVDSRLRRSPSDRASERRIRRSYGQAEENAPRFPRLDHRSAAAHKLHSATATTRIEFDSGKGEPFSRQPALAYSPWKLSKRPGPPQASPLAIADLCAGDERSYPKPISCKPPTAIADDPHGLRPSRTKAAHVKGRIAPRISGTRRWESNRPPQWIECMPRFTSRRACHQPVGINSRSDERHRASVRRDRARRSPRLRLAHDSSAIFSSLTRPNPFCVFVHPRKAFTVSATKWKLTVNRKQHTEGGQRERLRSSHSGGSANTRRLIPKISV